MQTKLFDFPPHAPYQWNRSSIDGAKKANQSNAERILAFIRASDGATRREISESTGLPINIVTGRVRELMDRKDVMVDGTRLSPYGVRVEILKTGG